MAVPPSSLRRLLLVEDDRMVRDTIVLMLEDEYEVVQTGSANGAMALLREAAAPVFEIMLLDCLLPGGGVPELLAAADELGIAVLLTSGDPNQAGAVDPGRTFLPKPFSRTSLLSVLHKAVR